MGGREQSWAFSALTFLFTTVFCQWVKGGGFDALGGCTQTRFVILCVGWSSLGFADSGGRR